MSAPAVDTLTGVSMWSRPKRLRLYSSTRHRPRARRATDVLLLVSAALGIAALVASAEPPTQFERALIDLANSLPTFLDVVWDVLAGALLIWAGLLLVLSLA